MMSTDYRHNARVEAPAEEKTILQWLTDLAPRRICVKEDRANGPTVPDDLDGRSLLEKMRDSRRGSGRSAVGASCSNCVQAESSCRRNAQLFASGCDERGCRTNALEVFCTHEKLAPRLAKGGPIALLNSLFSMGVMVAGFGAAKGYEVLSFAALWSVLLAALLIALSGSPSSRKTASVQFAIAGVLAGALVFARYDGAHLTVLCASAAVIAVSLVLGLARDMKLGGLIRFTTVTAVIGLGFSGLIALPLRETVGVAMILTSLSLGLGLAGSWLREAAEEAFSTTISVPLRIKRAPHIPLIHRPLLAPRHTGVVGATELAAVEAIGLSVRILNAGIASAQWSLDAAFRTVRGVEKWVRRSIVRLGQIVREERRLVLAWLRCVAAILDDRLLPSVGGMALFSVAGIALALGSSELCQYVGSGQEFGPRGWNGVLQISGFAILAITAWLLACATYGDDYLTAVQSIGNFLRAYIPGAVILLAFLILCGVIGLPLLGLVPIADGVVSTGPYSFGPASAISTVVVGAVMLFAVTGLRERTGVDDVERAEASLPESLGRVLRSLQDLQVVPLVPVILISGAGALVMFAVPAVVLG